MSPPRRAVEATWKHEVAAGATVELPLGDTFR